MENLIFTQLTIPEVKTLLRQVLEGYFAENPIPTNQAPPTHNIVDLTGLLEARPMIGSRSTLYKKVSKGLIPHSKQGKKLYFNLEEIDRWLLANKVKTVDDRQADVLAHISANQ